MSCLKTFCLFLCLIGVSRLSPQSETIIEITESHPKEIIKHEKITRGIFEIFLMNWLKLLTWKNIKIRKLREYCRTLEEELCHMDYKWTAKLSDYFKSLSKLDAHNIQEEFKSYKDDFENNTSRRRREFFYAIERAFNAQQAGQFMDYIYELKDWLQNRKNYIADETYNLIKNIIIRNIQKKLSVREQIELERNLKRAVREYRKKSHADEDLLAGFPERLLTLANLKNFTFNIDDYLHNG